MKAIMTQHVSGSRPTPKADKRKLDKNAKKLRKHFEKLRLLKLETTALLKLCASYPTPRSLMISLLVKNEEWDQLVKLEINSKHYLEHEVDRFRSDYQVTSLLRKSPTLPTSFDRRDEAVKGFYKAESQCAETNARLDSYAEGGLMPLDWDVHLAVLRAREYIFNLLGDRPSREDLSYAESKMRFGPGATTALSGVVTQGAKYSSRTLEVTPRLSDFGIWCLPHLWKRQSSLELRFRETSKFTTVRKDATKDRGICIEPDLNVYVQLGIGALLRSKLRSDRLDLDTAADWNRWLASQAYIWRLTTLDLSSASDTVSRSVVWLLCPERWVELLLLARVDKTWVSKVSTVTLEKWSSMGNGYTFELETLLFWGILNGCLSVMGLENGTSACFGDDLIFPSEATSLVTRTLDFLGFSVNERKTFSNGLFYESCGNDFFAGQSVRPVFWKGNKDDDDNETTYVQTCYRYANSIRRWSGTSVNHGGSPACDARVLPAWLSVFGSIPKPLRYRIPEGCGDDGVIGNFDEAAPSIVPLSREEIADGWSGIRYRCYYRPTILDTNHYHGAYLATLAGRAREASRGEHIRGRFGAARTRLCYQLWWPNLGPWK